MIIIGLMFLAVGLTGFMFGIGQILKGFALAIFTPNNEWQEERINICNNCAPGRDTCPMCKCFKVPKAKLKSETCPKNIWIK